LALDNLYKCDFKNCISD